MDKINFEEFKRDIDNFQGKNIIIKIEKVFELTKIFKNANFDVNLNYISISNKDETFKIDTNYISNFYEDDKCLKCEVTQMMDILILLE